MGLNPGTQLGPYEIVSPLGAGGMGEVYRARDVRLDRVVAVKVLSARLANESDALARFEREAKAVAALSHPNILVVHDVGRFQDVSYVVTELLEGETLRSRIDRSVVASRQAVSIGIEVAEGLSAAHAKGIVHRDIKPENLFLTAEGHVKILDFGLAHSTEPATVAARDSLDSPTATLETHAGSILGTLCYMAPEQVRAQATDARTDIFAFGCVLYEMLSGLCAFRRDTTADTMSAILREEPRGIASIVAGIDPDLERVIERCLEKRPAQRFQSATDLCFALRSILSHVDRGANVARQPGRRETIGLAVLPFVNASSNADLEYLADGVTESLINALSRIARLRVAPTSTVFKFKGRATDSRVIGGELGVGNVVTGRVNQRVDRLTIQVEVVDTQTGAQRWGERYDRPSGDLLVIERDITKDIVDALALQLTGDERKAAANRYTENDQAYRLYLEGRYWWKKRTENGFSRALQLFRQALTLDPDYPFAHVGLADCYLLLGIFHRPPVPMLSAAKAAAAEARRLDPTLAEALAPLAFLRALSDYEWEESLAMFREGIALNPRYPTLHHWYAVVLNVLGRSEEVLEQISLGCEIDPDAVLLRRELGWHYVNQGQYDRAVEHMRRLVEMDPAFVLSYPVLGEALVAIGDHDGAAAAFRKLEELSGRFPMHAGQLPRIDALVGRRDQALQGVQGLIELDREENAYASAIASVYTALGDLDKAFTWLHRALERREWSFGYTCHWPRWSALRRDGRFAGVRREMRLPIG